MFFTVSNVFAVFRRALPRVLTRAGAVPALAPALLLALALLAAAAPLATAAQGGRYGAPLRFDSPPVDLDPAPRAAASEDAGAADADGAPAPVSPASPASSPPASPGAPAAQGAPKPIRLFGTVEFRTPLSNLPKWERVRSSEIKAPTFGGDEKARMTPEVAARWDALRDKLKSVSDMDKAKGVNSFFNQWPYKTDQVVWGVEDYWATPAEFIKRSGDCEDYAIAKYYALRNLGMPAPQLRVIAVKDTIRNLGHAVLIVFIEGNAYVLDNLTNMVLSHSRLTHYAPQFSVNEEYLWRHVKPVSGPK